MEHHNSFPHTKQKKGIAIFTVVPPPYGGVSVHVERLMDMACAEGIPYQVYDQLGKNIPERHVKSAGKSAWAGVKFLLTVSEPVIHCHNNSISAIILSLLILRMRRKLSILTLHSEKPLRNYYNTNYFVRWLIRLSLGTASHIFCVNENIENWLLKSGIYCDRITMTPAFLRPTIGQVDESNLSQEIKEFIASNSPIIGSHGWFGYFLNGIHVYSFDMIADLASAIRNQFPNAGIYTLVSGTYDSQHREYILKMRKDRGLEKNWLILEAPFHAVALYAKSDIFVRPTITDGDSISIRECLYLGVPVVASDAVVRPPGCILFRSRDTKSMIGNVIKMLNNIEEYRKNLKGQNVEDSSSEILHVYRESLVACMKKYHSNSVLP